MTDMKQQALRLMLQRKKEMDEAWRDSQRAREEYKRAQDAFLGLYSRAEPPLPVICGSTFIKLKYSWDRADEEIKFDYEEGERCPTSD